MLRVITVILILFLPDLISGMMSGGPKYLIKPVLPDSIQGIQISIEVRSLSVDYNGSTKNICVLSANILNSNPVPQKFRITYQWDGQEMEKFIEIDAKQQRIFLLDKQFLHGIQISDKEMIYSHVSLDYNTEPESFASTITAE